MSIEAGTPTVWQKLAVAFGFGASAGLTPEQITAVQAGEHRDLTTAEKDLLVLFQPILNTAEQTALGDLTTFLRAIAGIGSVTSIGQAASIINAALQAEAGSMQKQAIALGQTSLTTLISAALAAAGKVNLPLVG